MTFDSTDDLDNAFTNLDPSKIGLDIQPRFLDRQIVITISASDDASFTSLATIVEKLKEAYETEMQHLHSSKP